MDLLKSEIIEKFVLAENLAFTHSDLEQKLRMPENVILRIFDCLTQNGFSGIRLILLLIQLR